MKTDLERLKQDVKKAAGLQAQKGHCVRCGEAFSDKNVFTQAGWKETNITQMCERCFDQICGEIEE